MRRLSRVHVSELWLLSVMEPQAQNGHPARSWTVAETHALLDLIRDLGLIRVLARKGFQNWDVYERLCVLLNRCNIRVSATEVKVHWQALKVKFWGLKRLVDTSQVGFSGITADFPFYEEMEQILIPQSRARSCKREADSSGQEELVIPSSTLSDFGFSSDHEDQAASSSHQETEQGQNVGDPGPDIVREAPCEAVPVGPGENVVLDIQSVLVVLHNTVHQILKTMDRLVRSLERLSGVEEQLSIQMGYMCSVALRTNTRLCNASSERRGAPETTSSPRTGLRRPRVMGQRRSVRYRRE